MNATIDLDDAEALLAADLDGSLQAASMAGSQVRAVGTAIAEGALEPLRSEDRSRAVVWVSGRAPLLRRERFWLGRCPIR
ncbi:hypothetical protein I540_4258 [Mycobacteroides abscessus subsp. bolletii 1513]|uniref:TobH protein n=1 Tax=Mycobacteroides abscessus subsp. bolletii 1513 TaxID=1299321 RepID=X8DGS2_9MYCO|nr:hypothetical protein I540_4258 [Mycobacteroides abscessus subsp. bolletii 1513]